MKLYLPIAALLMTGLSKLCLLALIYRRRRERDERHDRGPVS